ncbi:MAG: hypothetical protein QXO16_04800 [Archaeoglobaceae archaeon]
MHPIEIELLKVYEEPKTFLDWQKEICKRYSIDLEYLKPLEILSKLKLKVRGSLKSFEGLELKTYMRFCG